MEPLLLGGIASCRLWGGARFVGVTGWEQVDVSRQAKPIRAGRFHRMAEKARSAGPADKAAAVDVQEGPTVADLAGSQERKGLRFSVQDPLGFRELCR